MPTVARPFFSLQVHTTKVCQFCYLYSNSPCISFIYFLVLYSPFHLSVFTSPCFGWHWLTFSLFLGWKVTATTLKTWSVSSFWLFQLQLSCEARLGAHLVSSDKVNIFNVRYFLGVSFVFFFNLCMLFNFLIFVNFPNCPLLHTAEIILLDWENMLWMISALLNLFLILFYGRNVPYFWSFWGKFIS